MHYTIKHLKQIDAQFPTARKLLVVPGINLGRELLASLAREQGSWIGWEVATLATIAGKLSMMELARRGRRRASDVAIADAVSVAFDRAVDAGEISVALASLAWSAGTRRAIADAVLEARIAGVTESALRSLGTLGVASSLAAVMKHYELVRAERAVADTADVFSAAVSDFEAQSKFFLDHSVIVATPGWTVRGEPRRLLERLVGQGLQVLPPVRTLDTEAPSALVENFAPIRSETGDGSTDDLLDVKDGNRSIAMFYATDSSSEMRSVLRQALAAGRSLDDVEIACTDRDAYGVTLDALSRQLGINCTILDGLPLTTTRIGRACERWLLWIESGFQSSVLREALESGDFTLSGVHTPTQLSAELRSLKIGWGLGATRRAASTLRSQKWQDRLRQFEGEDETAFAERRARRQSVMAELATLLEVLLAIAPEPDSSISAAQLATRTIDVLKFMVARGAAELSTRQRLIERLQEIAAVDGAKMPLTSAIASVRLEMADLRAWTDSSRTAKPRRATGGHVHLTSIENAGATGRPLQFIVGLDADRVGGPVMQSALLPDALRLRLNERGADLPSAEQRRRERAWHLENAIAGSCQRLTLSYPLRASAESRESGPAPALLDAARRAVGDSGLSYGDLHAMLGAPRSAVPIASIEEPIGASVTPIRLAGEQLSIFSAAAAGERILAPSEQAVDARDVWLAAMGEGPILLDATDALRASFPGLARGLGANDAREVTEAGAYQGLVPGAGVLDPRTTGKAISPSSLERIARCGLNWFYSVALNARVHDEPMYDALVWLNAMDRGTALHRIYEVLIRSRLHEQSASAARDAAVAAVVHEVAREMEVHIPAPTEIVRAREISALLEDTALFITTEHTAFQNEPWETVALESQFGDDSEAALLLLEDGQSLRLHGRVDRVDKLQDGTLRLVDYKTGRAFELDNKNGVFDGGRKLQLALYSPAISSQLHAVVSLAEYRFTTAKGDGGVARADEAMLQSAPRIVQSLLDDVAAGRFLPTMDAADCRYCDYASVCRVSAGRFSSFSPRAEWAKRNAEANVHYDGMRLRRRAQDDT